VRKDGPVSSHGFRFERDERRRRVVVTLAARVTVDVWWASVSALVREGVWAEPVVYDMHAVESAPLLLNLPNLTRMVQGLVDMYGPRDPVAVVVGHDDLTLWRQRLSAFDHVIAIDAFPSVEAAHEWLDTFQARAS
jgi:hypothetical protein